MEIGLKNCQLLIAGVTVPSSAFYKRYKNFIAYTRYKNVFWGMNNRMVYLAENRDKVYIYGSELSRKYNISKWIELPNGLSVRLAIGYNQDKSQISYLADKYLEMDSITLMTWLLDYSMG